MIRFSGLHGGTTKGVQKVLQDVTLDWKTFQNLYTDKTHISCELMWA